MRTLAVLFLYVIIAILAIPVIFVCWVFDWLEPLAFVGRTGVRLGRIVLGLRIEITGLEKIGDDRTYVFMPNHESFLDGPMMFIVLPQFIRVIIKKELFRIPILAQGFKVAGFIPVDRKGQSGGKKAVEKAVHLIKTKKYSFMVFPEGTRTLDGKLQRFRRGGFYLALHSGVPIVPISINNAFELMPKHSFFTKRGTIGVKIHDPVPMDGYSEANLGKLMERVRNAVLSGLEDSA
jgi:1-acyl-sn-glycerol-3-phosphate acyltransferase